MAFQIGQAFHDVSGIPQVLVTAREWHLEILEELARPALASEIR